MAYNTGTLTGTYQHFNGDPAEGVVEIIPNSKSLIDSEGNVILTGRVKVTLDANGSFAVILPATDDATVEPAIDRQYTVVAKLRHQHLPAVTGIELPTGETLDMADLTPAEEATASLSVWLTEEEYTALEATVAGKADTASLATVATSGAYTDLTAKPTIPTTPAEVGAEPAGLSAETEATLAATYAGRVAGLRPVRINRRGDYTMIGGTQPGHAWTSVLGSNNLNDTTDYAIGTQSIQLVSLGTGVSGPARLDLTGLNIDTTGKDLAIWMKVDDTGPLGTYEVFAGNGTSWANYYRWPSVAGSPRFFFDDGAWVVLTLSFQDAIASGTPTRTGISRFRIAVSDDGTGPVTAHFNGLATKPTAPAFPNGVVSITFDDSNVSQFTKARPILNKYAYAATNYSIVENIGLNASYMTLDQLKQLRDLSGWEIAAHALTNTAHTNRLTSLTPESLTAELAALKEWLLDNGFDGADHLAYPGGIFNNAVVEEARKFFASARTTIHDTQETLPPADPMKLRAWSIDTSVSRASVTAKIDKAYANGGWFIMCFHDIADAATGIQTATAEFQAIVDYCATKAIPVRSVGDVLRALA